MKTRQSKKERQREGGANRKHKPDWDAEVEVDTNVWADENEDGVSLSGGLWEEEEQEEEEKEVGEEEEEEERQAKNLVVVVISRQRDRQRAEVVVMTNLQSLFINNQLSTNISGALCCSCCFSQPTSFSMCLPS